MNAGAAQRLLLTQDLQESLPNVFSSSVLCRFSLKGLLGPRNACASKILVGAFEELILASQRQMDRNVAHGSLVLSGRRA
jgi:hypothetical protein